MNLRRKIGKKCLGFSLIEVMLALHLALIVFMMMAHSVVDLRHHFTLKKSHQRALLELNNLQVIHELSVNHDVSLLQKHWQASARQYLSKAQAVFDSDIITLHWGHQNQFKLSQKHSRIS